MRKFFSVFKSSSRHVKWYDSVEKELGEMPRKELSIIMRSWASELMSHANIEIEVIGKPSDEKVIFVGNHVSYLDIPLLLSQVAVSFVAKEELLKWPLLNAAFKRAHIIFVKRESESSRRNTIEAIGNALKSGKLGVALFPSGTTDIAEKKPWKRGAFNLAKSTGFKVQPFRIAYQPLRRVAYIDKDFFPVHLYNLLRTDIKATIEFHDPVEVEDVKEDAKKWQSWSQGLLQR